MTSKKQQSTDFYKEEIDFLTRYSAQMRSEFGKRYVKGDSGVAAVLGKFVHEIEVHISRLREKQAKTKRAPSTNKS